MTDKEMSAFIECHIEQSRNLDDAKLSVATVKSITGIYREVVTVQGKPIMREPRPCRTGRMR